jgi:hypothetical protein
LARLTAAYASVAVRVVADGGIGAAELFELAIPSTVRVLVCVALGENLGGEEGDKYQY